MFIQELFHAPTFYVFWVLTVTFSICVHECSHAYVAYRCGDDTAYRNGFMCLNPLRVMGITSLICLALFGISWGGVPVNNGILKRYQQSLVALAGPFSNLAIAIIFVLGGTLSRHFIKDANAIGFARLYMQFFQVGVLSNCLLFVFNLIPLPILDGWCALEPFVPPMRNLDFRRRNTITLVGFLLLCFTPASSIIWRLVGKLQNILAFY